MKKLVTAEVMQQLDKMVIEELGIKSTTLMENAAQKVFDMIVKYEEDVKGKKITVVCGKGNNGGDGLLVAQHLKNAGADTTVFVLAKKTAISADSKKALTKLTKVYKKTAFVEKIGDFTLSDPDLIVDAIFGTGFNSNPEGLFYDVIKQMNESKAKIYSIDTPSGLHGSTGNIEDIAVKATRTITLAYGKVGLYVNDGYTYSGDVDVVDIGFPESVNEEIQDTRMLTEVIDTIGAFKDRELTVDKKEFGKVFNFSGSLSMPGAAVLSSTAALRTGTGLLKLGIPMNISASVSTIFPEIMSLPLGYAQPGFTSNNAEKEVLKGYKWCDACLVGPGLSVHPETKKVVRRLIQKSSSKPIVLDADALNIMAEQNELFEKMGPNVVLTPHNSEMARMINTSKELFLLERIEIVTQKAIDWNCYIILKGTPTLIAYPDGRMFTHINKNPAMAVGGIGDTLSGIIVSLLGQKIPMEKAIVTALYIHSIAGRYATEKYGEVSMLPSDLIKEIPNAIKYLRSLGDK
ncbi:MAG: NAD(P)H-hydrate dehydratase [Candidatus Delongbacteria bacterium]|nr:NAD(P)H-hydrate dehydratase [Candidatus Delongbacteria bacterium]